MLHMLNMAPTVHAQDKPWFTEPWRLEGTECKHMVYVPFQTPMAGKDGDSEVMREATIALERAQAQDLERNKAVVDVGTNGDVDNGVDTSDFIAKETRSMFRDMLDNLEPHICEASELVSIVSPVVEYSRHQI